MKIHLMGIGGTGMASLAGMLKEAGHEVRGSDQGVYPPMSDILKNFGIPVACPYDEKNMEPTPDLVVIGNVISRGNPEAEAVLNRGIPYASMPETLRRFFLQGKTSLVIAGTHGKTTTTSLMAWVLQAAGKNPSFFVGGKPKNFPQNFQLGQGPHFVLEGDEYDTAFFDKGPKFLHYQPKHVLLTSVEFDHADIYQDLEQILNSFRKLLRIIPEGGSLIANGDYPVVRDLLNDYRGRVLTYGMDPENRKNVDYFAEIFQSSPKVGFRIFRKEEKVGEVLWDPPGAHNVLNAMGVTLLGLEVGLSWDEIRPGLESFSGVARRQEILGEAGGVLLIDDFAHHPTAVRETLEAIRAKYPDRRIWALFEPRSNTSKRDVFQQDYAKSFDAADRVLIADVFMPEKVKDGKVLNTQRLAEEITSRGRAQARHLSGAASFVETIISESKQGDVVLMMSNGDFEGLGPKLLKALASKG